MDCGTFVRLWRNWIRLAVFVLYGVAICIALPLCIWHLDEKRAAWHVQAWFIGGLFVMMALPISLGGIMQHVINYTTPHLQKFIIRILWMVPIYALNAWFALRFPSAAIYLDTLRECYEAYVIYNFMAYLLSFLNHEYPHLDVQIQNKPPVKFLFPLNFLPPIENSGKFVTRCKHGVLQYTVVRPVMTIIALICEMFGEYNEGDFDFKSGWSFIVIINNGSQILAMYCLVLFYKAFKEELQYLNPVPKFLCVKAVVFSNVHLLHLSLPFLRQSLVIAALAKVGVIPQNGPWVYYDNIHEVATGIQDFCICIEMFLAAIAHYYSFSHKPFVNLAAEQQNCCTSFLLMWDVRDVGEDVVEHARYIGRGMHKTISRGARLAGIRGEERTPLLSERNSQTQVREQLDENSVEYLENQRSSSPTDHIDHSEKGDDTHSAGGDTGSVASSRKRYGSFATKSTTSSMYNYAEFGASTEDGRSQSARGARVDKQFSGFEKSMEGLTFGGAGTEEDEFQHIGADDISDSETLDETNQLAAVQEGGGDGVLTQDKNSELVKDSVHHEDTQVDVHNTDDNTECV
ncbi:hypothetical protein EGW08_008221 [Elysia chlorotica]|uniref:Transmembrane protein 184C n=1 Tax=Elysia chlorotica TaxID=188477 RepID=A0A433TQY5_ELYCH|nr:hypothetical protein EGW08_008221 [Elysia chlorotica]